MSNAACHVPFSATQPLPTSSPASPLPPRPPLPQVGRAPALAALDDPLEWPAFSKELSGSTGQWESQVVVQGMHCAACAMTVEQALLKVPGVRSARVSAASRRASLVWDSTRVLPSQWMGHLQTLGYALLPANDAFAIRVRSQERRAALWRWLVAGLCMMQVMMYAYPAYTAAPGDLSREMEQLLRWASWVLSLPVLLFSCGPFFSSAWRDLLARRIGMDLPVALGIAVTFAVSSAGTFDPAGPFGREVYFDSLTMFVFFLLSGRWLELRLRDRTAGALDAVFNRLPDSVERLGLDGSVERIAARRVRVGDVLRVYAGETFPADSVVLEGSSAVDEAMLTGESRPLARGPGDSVLAGSHNLAGTLRLRVEKAGRDTRFAAIVALMQSAATEQPQLARLADPMAKPFLLGVLLAAALVALWWWPHDPAHAMMLAVAVLVVTCPCALSLATPAAMLAAAGRLATGGVLVRRLQALETLARVDTLVFDKTGTLSTDSQQIADIECRAGLSAHQALAMAAALACHSRHPAAKALLEAAQEQATKQKQAHPNLYPHAPAVNQGATFQEWLASEVQEIAGRGITGDVRLVDAAASPLVGGLGTAAASAPIRLGSPKFCELPDTTSDASSVMLADEHGWMATFVLREALRPDAQACVYELAAMGLAVHLLSGDAPGPVARAAAQLGIAPSQAHARCTPDDKLARLRQLQARGATVAMVGDGLNDAPVLAGAHVAFAFGQASSLAQSQADFVVLGSELSAITNTLVLARKTMRVVRQNLLWALLYNAACVPLAVAGYLPAWLAGLGMASSSLLVVANAARLARSTNPRRAPNPLHEAHPQSAAFSLGLHVPPVNALAGTLS